jgi:flavin reductase (DIM6/NTAB) family NADH-FMN oxidoreductase RutF
VAAVCAEVEDGDPVGMAVSSYTSVSLDPPLVSICVDRNSRTWPRLQTATRLGVSILADEHGAACRQLSAKNGDRFAGLELEKGCGHAVFLSGATAWLECSIHTELAAGDHWIVLLRVEALAAEPSIGPLVFHGSRFHRLLVAG